MGYSMGRNGSPRACRFCPAASASPAASCARRALRLHACSFVGNRHALCGFQETVDGERDVYRCVQLLLELLTSRDPPDYLALGLLRYREWAWADAHAAFELAAEEGDAASPFAWALMLESKELCDLPGSREKAARYYRLAAEQGLALAQLQMGVMLESGEIDADDDDWADPLEHAVMYYRAAVSQGVRAAFYNLGSCYLNGVGVKQSLGMARWYFAEAAARGYGDAEREIAPLDALIAADEVVIVVSDSDSETTATAACAVWRGTGLGYDNTCPVSVDSDSESADSD